MEQKLKQSIIKTLAYFDYFDHPLTKEELFEYLWQAPQMKMGHFLSELDNLEEPIMYKRGFYYLQGREDIIDIRLSKTVDNDKKNQIAKRAAQKIRWVPFVQAVFVCNNTAFEMAKEKSDIDVVIVIKKGRLWIGRLFVTLLLSIFRLRRSKRKTINRICLSFYAIDQTLDFSPLRITKPDIGLIYWIMQFVAIYDPYDIHSQILQSNCWIKDYLPNSFNKRIFCQRFFVPNSQPSKGFKEMWQTMWKGTYGDFIEIQAKAIQKAKMKMNKGSVQNEPDTRVVINDDVLKFHEKDRREEYQRLWEGVCLKYGA